MTDQPDGLFDPADLAAAPTYSVHCFFNCGHITRAEDPDTSGAAMEQHYAEQHTADIDRALGFLGRTRTKETTTR